MRRIVIVRHAETEDNIVGLVTGQSDPGLSQLGHEQATALAIRLRELRKPFLISSDLRRCRETLRPYLSSSVETSRVAFVPELREKGFGEFEGGSCAAYERAIEESGLPFHIYRPVGGESFDDLDSRLQLFLPRIFEMWESGGEETLLVCAHASVNRGLLGYLLELSFDERSTIEQKNCCVNELEKKEGGWTVIALNDVSHLDEKTHINPANRSGL